jgi:hypothetical protein
LGRINLILLAIFAMILSLSGNAGAYTWYTNSDNGHQYALTSIPSSWTNAEIEAVTAGGHLVTINNAAEQEWLVSKFGKTDYLWIGFNIKGTGGNWEWISGEAATYTYWGPGEPNNWAGAEDVAFMNYYNVQWADWPDGGFPGTGYYDIRGIIERAVPLPATLPLVGSGLLAFFWWRRR